MRRKISNYLQELWNWIRIKLNDRCGELKLGEGKSRNKRRDIEPDGKHKTAKIIEREIIIDNMKIHIKSVFTEQTQLEEAMKSIIIRKLVETNKPT
jgi:hypothetical protein